MTGTTHRFPASGRQNQSWPALDSEIPKCHVSNRWSSVTHNAAFIHKGSMRVAWMSRLWPLLRAWGAGNKVKSTMRAARRHSWQVAWSQNSLSSSRLEAGGDGVTHQPTFPSLDACRLHGGNPTAACIDTFNVCFHPSRAVLFVCLSVKPNL